MTLSVSSARSSAVQHRLTALAAAALLFTGSAAHATTVSPNTGSLGAAANGTNSDSVTFGPGAIAVVGDQAAVYTGVAGSSTSVPFNSSLNPAAVSPFSIEFWGRPTATDNDDSPVSNRRSVGVTNRSGWAFFQRSNGWNIKMYNGVGSDVGWDLTGGASPDPTTTNNWNHVVATWSGSAALLYVNGVLVDNTNDKNAGATEAYVANTSTANFLVAATDSGSPYAGSVDEVAFYSSVLSPAQIANHFTTGTATPGAYHNLIRTDGALLQLSNPVPEPTSTVLLSAAGALLLGRRRRA